MTNTKDSSGTVNETLRLVWPQQVRLLESGELFFRDVVRPGARWSDVQLRDRSPCHRAGVGDVEADAQGSPAMHGQV